MRRIVILAVLAIAQVANASPRGFDDFEDDDDDSDRTAVPLPMAIDTTHVTGPPIEALLSAGYAAAGLDREPGRGWVRRARLAGLIPWVSVRTGRDTSWKDEDQSIGHGTTLEARATWRLDRLVFDGRELQVASLESARRRERHRLANRVIRLYFLWRRASAASVRQPKWTSHANEAAAELDALTDGWFTEAIKRLQRREVETQPAE